MSDSQAVIPDVPWHHPPEVRDLLHRAGLSRNTEIEPGRYHVAEAAAALEKNPKISQHRLLSILRPPLPEKEYAVTVEKKQPSEA